MYIQPGTNINILHNVPLDNTYDHTIHFSSEGAQYSYFAGLVKYTLTTNTYQRVNKGRARVGIKADDLYDCNYMMFQNSSFGNKWFYAFITSVEYVNNVTADITFELDVIQSWYFDWEFEQCFIERMTTPTDEIGEHIEPEPVTLGEYVYNDYKQLSVLSPLAVIVAYVDADKGGRLYGGVYGGCTLVAFNANDVSTINSFLDKFIQKPDSIVDMYLVPAVAVGGLTTGQATIIETSKKNTIIEDGGAIPAVNNSMELDGYKPKNNKMYTYPYNFVNINNASNGSINLRYEFFTDLTPHWEIAVPITKPVECILRPTHYKGSSNKVNTSESISLSGYPTCSWNFDTYKVWATQSTIPYFMKAANSVANAGIVMAATGGIAAPLVGAKLGTSLFSQVTDRMVDGYKASIATDIYKGNLNSGSTNVGARVQEFFGGRMSITAQYAKQIDDFFTRFGYNVRRVGKPYTNNRPHWTYLQTSGCTVKGSIPADDMKTICSIHDNGITYWMNGNEVGDYSLNNSPEP